MNDNIELSVVVPVYNEEDNIEELVTRVTKVMGELNLKYELLCVDDKSDDHSVEKLKGFIPENPIRIIALGKHMGQSAALAAGFMKARGKLVAMIDADMQCRPEDIALLLKSKEENIAAVCGIREKRMDNISKKISTVVGNTFRNLITGDKIKDTNCPLKLFEREAILSIPYFRGFHRFIPTLLKVYGYDVKHMPVEHFPRLRGISKYNVANRLFKGFFDVFGVLWVKKNALVFDKMKEL